MRVFLGSIALEPNRWGALDATRRPTIALSSWLTRIRDAGFDGVEVWEGHLTMADGDEASAIVDSPVPLAVFNTYASLDDRPELRAATDWVIRSGADAVKFNVGFEPSRVDAYAERISEWAGGLPEHVTLLCECHDGTAAKDPRVAAQIMNLAGPPERVGAIVHTHDRTDQLALRFDHYGSRIAHVHVNYLDLPARSVPRLADVRADLARKVATMRVRGFDGTWTLEFVHGTLSADETAEALFRQACDDLAVLREVLT